MTLMAKQSQTKVIHHRGGMRPNTPDRGAIRPLDAPADKGGAWQSQNGNGTTHTRRPNTSAHRER